MIILLSGKQGSGKSTLAEGLLNRLPGITKVMKFADPLYAMHDACLPILKEYGIRDKAMIKDGDLLQILGTEYGRRKIREDLWVEILRQRVNTSLADNIIIDDARFINEVNMFPDALKVRLECPVDARKPRVSYWREDQSHPSETGLDSYKGWDVVVFTDVIPKHITLNIVLEHYEKKQTQTK